MTKAEVHGRRRRGFALIITLMLVVLLATTMAQLATVTSVESIRIERRVNTLTHELAADSALRVAAQRLRNGSAVVSDIDRLGSHVFTMKLGRCRVRCRIADDGAKFDVRAFDQDSTAFPLRRKLEALGRRFALTETRIRLKPLAADSRPPSQRYVWFDQLFESPDPGALFCWTPDEPYVAWSDVVTCFGTGRVDVRRASRQVLDVLLGDLDRSLGRKISTIRKRHGGVDLQDILQAVDADVRQKVSARIAHGLERYALTIETAVRADLRQWYVVATINDQTIDVHYRGQIQW